MSPRQMQALGVAAAAIALGLVYGTVPGFRSSVHEVAGIIARLDKDALREYLRDFGIWAPVVSALVMVFQSVAAPLPAVVITVTNGLVFGAFWGTLLSWSSSMVGAVLCYYLARILGRPVVERLVSPKAVAFADRFFARYGRYAILIARLVPVVSFDVVSYAAGLTSIGFWEFTIATGIGQIPATVVYSILGASMTTLTRLLFWVVVGGGALLAFSLAVKTAVERRLPPESKETA